MRNKHGFNGHLTLGLAIVFRYIKDDNGSLRCAAESEVSQRESSYGSYRTRLSMDSSNSGSPQNSLSITNPSKNWHQLQIHYSINFVDAVTLDQHPRSPQGDQGVLPRCTMLHVFFNNYNISPKIKNVLQLLDNKWMKNSPSSPEESAGLCTSEYAWIVR